ncbi:THAP domain-containing protein 5 [Esox lucius]|uniref:THAP-type domain-containing protein n=1 Tax=Esox lucius TaxID=8010 RepID=A0AAY5KYS5_ESOLU|nr:THAP domain-containing protein 5 [Esox lucius]
MPKYCSAPNCNHDSGSTNTERKSFYKFPLQDPDRLKLWLKNMGREEWTPSKHQYICNEHFVTSCFKLRWGIRYLQNNAVPTVFQLTEKRKGEDHSELQNPKRLRSSRKPRDARSSDVGVPGNDSTGSGTGGMVTLYEVTVEPLQAETPEEGSRDGAGGGFPVAFFQTVKDLVGLEGGGTHGEPHANADGEVVVVVSEPQAALRGLPAAMLTEGHDPGTVDEVGRFMVSPTSLVIENVSPELMEAELSVSQDDREGGAQVIAYFETIPNVVSSRATQFSIPPDTVLSSALSPTPIVSTLPIVSKHTPPSPGSLILTLERLETVGEEAEGDSPEEDMEQQGIQLEEHRYHKNSLSKEQLEAIVVELQKKVKVLQQRHRRHLDKLLGLENTVSQLRQNNLLNEERLQLLERAYIQTSAAVSEAGETVAIIYEEDNTAYLYEG